MTMILNRQSEEADFAAMLAIVNAAARAYRGVTADDRWARALHVRR